MTTLVDRRRELGLTLPSPTKVPAGLHLPFSFVNVRGCRALISGHPKHDADGSIVGPYGKVGNELSTEQGRLAPCLRDVFGPEVGRHARSAIGVAGLPLNFAQEIEAEVELVET
jgi:hypothetical protein